MERILIEIQSKFINIIGITCFLFLLLLLLLLSVLYNFTDLRIITDPASISLDILISVIFWTITSVFLHRYESHVR